LLPSVFWPQAADRTEPSTNCVRRTTLQHLDMYHMVPAKRQPLISAAAPAGNMTDQIAALSALVHVPGPERDAALADFYEQWKQQPLVMLKWLVVQVRVLSAGRSTKLRHVVQHGRWDGVLQGVCMEIGVGKGPSFMPLMASVSPGKAVHSCSLYLPVIDSLASAVAVDLHSVILRFTGVMCHGRPAVLPWYRQPTQGSMCCF
jgi:hypothetical protein